MSIWLRTELDDTLPSTGVAVAATMDGVKPQGGYLAKRCPEAVQLDVLWPCEPLPPSPFMTMLAEDGNAFEAAIFEAIAGAVAEAVIIDQGLPLLQREQATLGGLYDGAVVVVGGRLPADQVAHRVGEPDLLVRANAPANPSASLVYLPVDVKHHMVLEERKTDTLDGALTSPPEAPWLTGATSNNDLVPKWRRPDLLQLAHYQRMLEAQGLASSEDRWAGIIGSEGVLVWYDLDTPMWRPSAYLGDPSPELLSSMELYDVEFAHRLAVRDSAERHLADPEVPLLAEPIAVPECGSCPWHDWCYERMEENGDLSLLPQMTIAKRRRCHAHGVTTLRDLASLDWVTADLISCGVDLHRFLDAADSNESSAAVASLLARRPKQARILGERGIRTAADAWKIDRRTAGLAESRLGDLSQQIDSARARLGSFPAYRRRGVDGVVLPRADIEVDVDMENVSGGCYLWGTLTTKCEESEPSEGKFIPFVSWDPVPADGEIEAFLRFWEWLSSLQADVTRSGLTFRAYCYSQGAENGQMRRIADRCGLRAEVDAFIASDHWVDLYAVVKDQLITGTGLGLKVIAPAAGFQWRGDDAGGSQAMVRYLEATSEVDDAGRAAARTWILNYNEDDVRATAALRAWLDSDARSLPSIADWDVPAPNQDRGRSEGSLPL